ncbi:MAG: lamin tail domain-containing protein [Bacteroidales bacterium]|nr:lamin tail domain-containing protein [Bacteroidales bacterium]
MNKVILLVLLMPVSAFGQIMESFESGDISRWIQNPIGRWNCDNISALSGTRSFHHTFDNPESGTDCAGLPVKNLLPEEGPVKWSFKVRHGAEPSSSNKWEVFLLSDSDPAGIVNDEPCNGWAVGVNQTGNDDLLQLWKVTEGTFTSVIRGAVNWQSAIGTTEHVRIDVERSPDGRWEMKVFRQNGDLTDSCSVTDSWYAGGDWFIVRYDYTSSRDRLLWIDDIIIDGVFSNDTSPPPGAGDIIISEIMADPSPVVSLPASEYLEICNNSPDAINLDNWSLTAGTQDYHFPPVTIGPHEYMTVCHSKDAPLFSVYGKVTGLQSFPLLTDGGKLLALTDGSGNLIDGLEYSSDWYDDVLKSEGGWSLEIIDNSHPFSGDENWKASVSRKGGTPGSQNSVSGNNPDTHFTGITNVFPDDSITISLSFSESVPWFAGEAESIKIDDSDIMELYSSDKLLRKFTAIPDKPLEKAKIYSLNADESITDFAGNRMETKNFRFGIPEQVAKGDIIFSELLFNPMPGSADYIEFYNCSGKIIDLSRLAVVSLSVENSDTSDLYFLSHENRCLLPGDYYVITVDREAICDGFISSAPGRIFEVSSMPSMNDDGGHLILFSRELDLIDELYYDEDMHFSLLGSTEGIALERAFSTGLSSDRLWHSASESSGWGTPGATNSLVSESVINDNQISLSSTRITPDNDGNHDFLVISMKFTGNGNIVTATVFDENGGFVKKITDNLLTGPEASLIWDCTADDETLVSSGIYILLVTTFDDKGKTRRWKKVCTVVR